MKNFSPAIYLLFLVSLCAFSQNALQELSQKREKKAKEIPPALTSHVILISIDGLRLEDLNDPKLNLPTLKSLRDRGSYALNVESIYPSQSLPAHATIVTGMLPADHGIASDFPFDEKLGQTASEPHRFANEIKAETIWQAAKRAGLKTAAVNFPITEQSEIDLLEKELNATNTLIAQHRPKLMLMRFDDLSTSLQRFGLGSIEATTAMEKIDAAIKTILDSIEQAGLTNETTFLIVSSHGYAKVEQEFRPNLLLARKGFMTTDVTGKITSWIATTHSSGGAAAIYLQDQNNEELAKTLEKMFAQEIQQKDGSPIWRILSKKDAAKLGAAPRAALFLEAAPGFVISEKVSGKKMIDKTDVSFGRAASGYLPSRSEMRGLLIATGKGIKPKTQIEYARLVDIAPTIARLLGLQLKASRGRAISAIFTQ